MVTGGGGLWGGGFPSLLNTGLVVTDRSGLYCVCRDGGGGEVILSPLNTDFVVTDGSGLCSGAVMSSHFTSAV